MPLEREYPFRRYLLSTLAAASISIILVIVLFTQQIRHEQSIAVQSAWKENRARVQSFEQYVLRTLAVADVALKHVDDMATRNPEWIEQNRIKVDQTINSPLFTAVIIDFPGKAVLSNRQIPGLTSEKRELFRQWTSNRGYLAPVVTPPVDFPGLGPQVGVTVPLNSSQGGYGLILLDPRLFTDFADHVTFANDDLISLIGLDGITRARRTGSVFSTGEVVQGLVMQRQLADPDGAYFGPSVLDGKPRYFSHERLAGFNLFATSGMSSKTVESRVRERRNLLLRIMVAAIAAILAASVLVLSSMNRSRIWLEDLLQANKRLNEAQRIGSMGDWDYYPQTDQLHWSRNLRRMYGRTDQESISSLSDVSEYTSPADARRIGLLVSRIFETAREDRWDVKVRLADGSESHRRVVAVPILDENGQVVGIHGTDQDVTHEATIREMEQRLSELARLDSMGALTATLAHELNQPLGIAANYLAAASRSLGRSGSISKTREYLNAAKIQIEHLAQIIVGARELVTYSGSTSEQIELRALFSDVFAVLAKAVSEQTVETSINVEDGAEMVVMNRAQLKQVLFNLGRNALEAVPMERSPQISLSACREDEDKVRISVRDNGHGFPDKDGDPFGALVTSKPAGLGLGLALARTIVEFHGGKIWIEETSREGTTISFTIEALKDD